MKVAVIGANGQLGHDSIQEIEISGLTAIPLVHADIEITDKPSVLNALETAQADIVINTAAFHNVEKCETEPENAFLGNAWGAKNLAEASNELGFYLIHISTDYVFDGSKKAPYLESDLPLPLNVYANTKLSGEHFIQSIAKKYIILRTCGLYGTEKCRAKGGVNFTELMLKLAAERDELRVVDDEILTPTSTREVARQMVALFEKQPVGLAHATAEGECSWYEFAKTIFEIAEVKTNLNIAAPGEFPTKVNRPSYSVLENGFLKEHGVNVLKHWKEGLEEYLLKERVKV